MGTAMGPGYLCRIRVVVAPLDERDDGWKWTVILTKRHPDPWIVRIDEFSFPLEDVFLDLGENVIKLGALYGLNSDSFNADH